MVRGAAGVSMEIIAILKFAEAAIAQLGERQTEDLKVPGSIPGLGMASYCCKVSLKLAATGLQSHRPRR